MEMALAAGMETASGRQVMEMAMAAIHANGSGFEQQSERFLLA